MADSGHPHKKSNTGLVGIKKRRNKNSKFLYYKGFLELSPAKAKSLLERFGYLKALFPPVF
jgi:hypothetical protein